MYARKRLDIGWRDLSSGLVACAFARDEAGLARRIEEWFGGPDRAAFACLSVRSGLELYLETLALPKGSEVLMSALTIPDMWRVVEHHGLVPVPVDVEAGTLAPRPEAWRAAVTPRTRLAIVAHLFGTRIALDPLLELKKSHGLLVLEDNAQAYTGSDFKGHPGADVSMFSFGPIKTATALAGGVLCVRDLAILGRMRAAHATWPVQSRPGYAKRILKYALLKAITSPVLYTGFVGACSAAGTTHDKVIQGTVRGFKGGDFFEKIRHRPSAPLLALMLRRFEHGSEARVAERALRARRLIAQSGVTLEFPGALAPYHSFWVFTVLSNRPEELVVRLRERGFDATQAATMSALPAPAARPELEPREARAMLARLVYVPVYPEMPLAKIDAMAAILRSMSRPAGELAETELPHTQLAS
jgi:perosamine synthetase